MYMYKYNVHVGTCTCELLTRVAALTHVVVSVGAVQAARPRLFRRHAQAPAEAGVREHRHGLRGLQDGAVSRTRATSLRAVRLHATCQRLQTDPSQADAAHCDVTAD